jgi:hypothetical protein
MQPGSTDGADAHEKNVWLQCIEMWWEGSTQSNLSGQNRVFFAHWAEKNQSGQNFFG